MVGRNELNVLGIVVAKSGTTRDYPVIPIGRNSASSVATTGTELLRSKALISSAPITEADTTTNVSLCNSVLTQRGIDFYTDIEAALGEA